MSHSHHVSRLSRSRVSIQSTWDVTRTIRKRYRPVTCRGLLGERRCETVDYTSSFFSCVSIDLRFPFSLFRQTEKNTRVIRRKLFLGRISRDKYLWLSSAKLCELLQTFPRLNERDRNLATRNDSSHFGGSKPIGKRRSEADLRMNNCLYEQ